MYYPFFRGKQYELITIRECAGLMSTSAFVPILEPVKEALGGMEKVLEAVRKAEGKIVVIVNPSYGELPNGNNGLKELFDKIEGRVNSETDKGENELGYISPGILLKEDTAVGEVNRLIEEYKELPVSLIHAGFSDASELTKELKKQKGISRHIFLDHKTGKLYRKHFRDLPNILIRDGFDKQVNRDYPDVEFFSDLHATYSDEDMDGFGDFLMVGDEYTETGGPAYAVAIHLTYIDSRKDNEMHIYHFKSDRQDDPKDPAGKFAEALEKLVNEVQKDDTQISKTTAIEEFLELYNKGHFPGLGYVKKLSMKHHIETLAEYFGSGVR